MSNEKPKGVRSTTKSGGRIKLVDEKFKAEPKPGDEREQALIDATMDMDRYSQVALGQIETLAAFAIDCLDKPPTTTTLDALLDALSIIRTVASDAANQINVTAETVGANFKERRYRAWHNTLISAGAAGNF